MPQNPCTKKPSSPPPAERRRPLVLPLRLTLQQRATVALSLRVTPSLKHRLLNAGPGLQTVGVTFPELRWLSVWSLGLIGRHVSGGMRRNGPILEKIDNVFELAKAAEGGDAEAIAAVERLWKREKVFQFKITLRGDFPTIWRRIQVKDCSLEQLELYFAGAMGWSDPEVHKFEIDGHTYVTHDPRDSLGFDLTYYSCYRDEAKATISQVARESPHAVNWTYFRGDPYPARHEVRFEGPVALDRMAVYPRCLEGENASVPTFCWSFFEYVGYMRRRKIRNKQTPDGSPCRRPKFDPTKFSKRCINYAMRRPQEPVSGWVNPDAQYDPNRAC